MHSALSQSSPATQASTRRYRTQCQGMFLGRGICMACCMTSAAPRALAKCPPQSKSRRSRIQTTSAFLPRAQDRACRLPPVLEIEGAGIKESPQSSPCCHARVPAGKTTSTWCPASRIQRAMTNMLRSKPPQPSDEVKKHMFLLDNVLLDVYDSRRSGRRVNSLTTPFPRLSTAKSTPSATYSGVMPASN